jgi:hypothetical protein
LTVDLSRMRLLRSHILRSVIGPFIFAWAALT